MPLPTEFTDNDYTNVTQALSDTAMGCARSSIDFSEQNRNRDASFFADACVANLNTLRKYSESKAFDSLIAIAQLPGENTQLRSKLKEFTVEFWTTTDGTYFAQKAMVVVDREAKKYAKPVASPVDLVRHAIGAPVAAATSAATNSPS